MRLRTAAVTRLIGLTVALAAAPAAGGQPITLPRGHRQATGVKVGEVTQGSAIIWVRLTEHAERNMTGLVPGYPKWDAMVEAGIDEHGIEALPEIGREKRGVRRPGVLPDWVEPADLEGACPGAAGRVRVRYGTTTDLVNAKATGWVDVDAETDFTHQFHLTGLLPNTAYRYETQTASAAGEAHDALRGRFRTAPEADTNAPVRFVVVTGMYYGHRDSGERDSRGYLAYNAMGDLDPHFIVPTGDTVYYDKDTGFGGILAHNVDVARFHWHRTYSMQRLLRFHLRVPGYWEKDDHDTVRNDCSPGASLGELTWDRGLAVFREQVPMGGKTYRTVRWGKALQVWMVEGRDFRSPNRMPDGPDKTIWGKQQKAWFKRTVSRSDATWKVLISPTPLVGPDRERKNDNHANAGFQHEGNEVRRFIRQACPDNFFVVCGDRHWQYHSVHPETGLNEFSSGPINRAHAGGSPGDSPMHVHHDPRGAGFASVEVRPFGDRHSTIIFRLHNTLGEVQHERSWSTE